MERDKLKLDVERVRNQYEDELNRLRREVEQSKESLMNMSKSKGAEVQSLMQKINSEKNEIENLFKVGFYFFINF